MKAMKAIKKIVALSAGVLMLGATVGSALALDLGDYPSPFAGASGYNSKIVVGSQAAAIDIVGSVNVAASFTGVAGQGQVVIETPVGTVANAKALDEYEGDGTAVDPDEMPMKGDTRILTPTYGFDEDDTEFSFMRGHKDSDVKEELTINITADTRDETGCPEEAILLNEFVYTLEDESAELDRAVDRLDKKTGTQDFQYDFKFLGKNFKLVSEDVNASEIVDAALLADIENGLQLQLTNADSYVVVGDVIELDTYGFEGYSLKIVRMAEDVGETNGYIIVALMKGDVTIAQETIQEGYSDNMYDEDNDDIEVEVYVDEVKYDASQSEYFGKVSFQSSEYSKGNFLDKYDIWEIKDLALNGTVSNPTLTIEITANEPTQYEDELECLYDSESYIYKGYSLDFEGYLELGFTELSRPVTGNVYFSIDKNGYLVIDSDDNVYVEINNADKYSDKEIKFDLTDGNGTVYSIPGVETAELPDADLNDVTIYIDDDNVYTLGYDNSTGELSITEPDTSDVITIADINGDNWDSNVYVNDVVIKTGEKTDLGTELDSFSYTGRRATFVLVDDAVRYQVYVGQTVGATENKVSLEVGDTAVVGEITSVGANPLPVGLAILDSDLSSADAVKDDHYIVVGGPCANSAAAALLGVTAENCAEGFTAGEAMIRLFTNDDKYQLLVAGASGQDTLLATKVLGSYSKYAEDFDGKTEVKVKGTSLSDVEITG